ncbi:MAG: response regulator, partial [Planctomycetes bacterium]|nr:response regulator [Planctomycetota bacterium]
MLHKEKVLFVDDDINILNAFKRAFRKKYNFETAEDPLEAINLIKNQGPFSVIVSDMNMPRMDGSTFLARLKNVCPQTIRIMLTGNSDVDTASRAVNEGEVFRLLTKPCSIESLTLCIDSAIEYGYLIKGEKDLLDNTLTGCLQLLSEMIDVSHSRIIDEKKLRDGVKYLCGETGVAYDWMMDVGCSLIQTGAVTISQKLFHSENTLSPVSDDEIDQIFTVPQISASMIEHIPRLLPVATMLRNDSNSID